MKKSNLKVQLKSYYKILKSVKIKIKKNCFFNKVKFKVNINSSYKIKNT